MAVNTPPIATKYQPSPRPANPGGEEKNAENKDSAQKDHPVFGDSGQHILEIEKDSGADEWADEATHSSEKRHDNNLTGSGPIKRFNSNEVEI